MKALQNYFRQFGIWEKEQTDISSWDPYKATPDNVEPFAHKYLNMDPAARNQDGSLTEEKKLCSCLSYISDIYRFNGDASDLEYITEAVRKYKTSAPVILYRGVSDVPMEKMIEAAKDLDDDVDFYERGFMSCTLLKETAYDYPVQLVIYVPPYFHVMYAGHCNDEEEPECRYECIIMRGAKLKIMTQKGNTYYCLLKSTN